VFGGDIFMAGGDEDFFFGGVSDEVNIYNIATDTWTGNGSPMPEGVVTAGFAQLGEFLYVVGGWNDSSPGANSQMTQRYDMTTDTWETGPAFTSGRADGALARTTEALYFIGGDGDGGGAFDPTDLVERLDTTVWPGGAWVDTGDPLPTPLTANTSGNCTEGLTGGEVWSTGGAFPIGGTHQYKTTGESCTSVDVPWLFKAPEEGIIPVGGNQVVDVTLDASVPEINQPGTYIAQIRIGEDTPGTVAPVQVTMDVPLPAGWGWLEGTINALGRCDVPAGGLEGATVFVDTLGVDWTLKTDENGFYKVAFPAADSPVTVTVSAEDFVGQSVSGVIVTDQGTTVQNFDLRLDAPCGSKTPDSFDVTLGEGGSTTQTLTLTNDGAAALNFEVFESTFDLPPQISEPKKKQNRNLKNKKKDKPKAGTLHPRSIRTRPLPTQAAQDPQATATWFGGSPLPIGTVRYSHARCDTDPNVFYIISGFDASFSYTDAAWRYDAEANTWTELASYPTASEGSTAVCYQGKIYVMGGFDDSFNPTDTLFIYDIASDTWSDRGVPLPRTVWGASAGAWDGKVFLIGGDNFGVTDEVSVYDIATETWTTATPMPSAAQLPGFFQTGNYVYLVGGWDANSPGANLAATQRYDMATDTWESGPTLNFPRSDLALAATDTALYSIGGDEDGGGFFDAINTVERLDLSTWPAGSWEDFSDPLPVALSSNNGGFCTEAIHVGGSVGEFWSVGGGDQFGNILGYNLFSPTDEHCFSIFSDVPWLEVTLPDGVTQVEGSVPPDSSLVLNVHFNAAGLAPGDYTASIVITTNDDAAPQFTIPVTLHVGAALFNDQFNDGVLDPNWKYKKNWAEDGAVLKVTSNNDPATAVATPVFAGCLNCSVSTSASTSGGNNGKLSFYGWWVSNKTYIELQVKENVDKVTIREKVNGKIKKKQSAPLTIDPNTFYAITMTYNGTDIVVNIDGTDVLTFTPKGTVQMGTVGFLVKGTGAFDYIVAN
jgi:N-acetylneuraminic acid mutarotase